MPGELLGDHDLVGDPYSCRRVATEPLSQRLSPPACVYLAAGSGNRSGSIRAVS